MKTKTRLGNCELCGSKVGMSIIVKQEGLLNKDGTVHEFHVCGKCFNNWTSQDYEELSRRLQCQN